MVPLVFISEKILLIVNNHLFSELRAEGIESCSLPVEVFLEREFLSEFPTGTSLAFSSMAPTKKFECYSRGNTPNLRFVAPTLKVIVGLVNV